MLREIELSAVVSQLKQFGCNARDAAVYVKSLQMGPASVQEIAAKLRQNRVTIHNVVERLIDKGLVAESRKGKRRIIVAEEPDVLYRLLQRKENELKLMQANLDYTVDLLQKTQAVDVTRPAVRFYEGVEGLKTMLEETLGAKDKVLVISNVDQLSELVNPEYLENYFDRRAQKGIHSRLIFPPGEFASYVGPLSLKYKIQVRLLPPELKWRSAIFSWNDCLSLMSFTEGKLTCTVIENGDIAHLFRSIIFELAWMQAEPARDW